MPLIVFSIVMVVAGIRNIASREIGGVQLGLCRLLGVLVAALLSFALQGLITRLVFAQGFTVWILAPYAALAIAEALGRHLSNEAIARSAVRLRSVDTED